MKLTKQIRATAAQWMIAAAMSIATSGWSQVAAPNPNPSAGDLKISLTAQKVTQGADGKETLQSAERAFPGEVVQYDALYLNKSRKALSDIEPTLPIPRGMTYVPDSAKPAAMMASLDGKTFEPIPIKRKVTLPDGTVEEREVPPTQYRALRWFVGDMGAGAQTTVIARAKIDPTAP
jgi:uncharacterized repeat protein (TIGR01451 family)